MVLSYGPADGKAGIVQNLAMAASVRDAVGDDYELMFDAFNGWTLPYATEMVRALEPLATGEHVYTCWQVKELLVGEAADVLQTDPDWTGGITELRKICVLASVFEISVVTHCHSFLPALHVAAIRITVNDTTRGIPDPRTGIEAVLSRTNLSTRER